MSEKRFIDTLGLSKKTLNALARAGVTTGEDILDLFADKDGTYILRFNKGYEYLAKVYGEKDLMERDPKYTTKCRIRNFGITCLKELISAMEKKGMNTMRLIPGIRQKPKKQLCQFCQSEDEFNDNIITADAKSGSHVIIGAEAFIENGCLSLYLANANDDYIAMDTVVIKYCPMCGRRL